MTSKFDGWENPDGDESRVVKTKLTREEVSRQREVQYQNTMIKQHEVAIELAKKERDLMVKQCKHRVFKDNNDSFPYFRRICVICGKDTGEV